jgi:hypothetical protein
MYLSFLFPVVLSQLMHQDDYAFPLMTIEAHHQVDLPLNNHIRFTNESQ